MADESTFEVFQGARTTFSITLEDEQGEPREGYTGSEARTLQVWPGGTEAIITLADSSVAWANAAAAELTVTIGSTDATALTAAMMYPFRVLITESAAAVCRYTGYLQVVAGPGSGTAGKIYGDFSDLIRHGRWVVRLQTSVDQAGFRNYLERARSWLDDAILAADRPDWGSHGRTKDDATFGAGGAWGMDGDAPPNKWLRDQLDADYLIVRDWVKEATARMALSFICEDQIGTESETQTPYQVLANRNASIAQAIACSHVAEIDFNADSQADYWVRIGKKSTR